MESVANLEAEVERAVALQEKERLTEAVAAASASRQDRGGAALAREVRSSAPLEVALEPRPFPATSPSMLPARGRGG